MANLCRRISRRGLFRRTGADISLPHHSIRAHAIDWSLFHIRLCFSFDSNWTRQINTAIGDSSEIGAIVSENVLRVRRFANFRAVMTFASWSRRCLQSANWAAWQLDTISQHDYVQYDCLKRVQWLKDTSRGCWFTIFRESRISSLVTKSLYEIRRVSIWQWIRSNSNIYQSQTMRITSRGSYFSFLQLAVLLKADVGEAQDVSNS